MVKYYVLVKRKTAKEWEGAVPAKAGVGLSRLKSVVKKNLKSGYTARIITEQQLKALLGRASPRVSRGRRATRKRRFTAKQRRALAKARRTKRRRR